MKFEVGLSSLHDKWRFEIQLLPRGRVRVVPMLWRDMVAILAASGVVPSSIILPMWTWHVCCMDRHCRSMCADRKKCSLIGCRIGGLEHLQHGPLYRDGRILGSEPLL